MATNRDITFSLDFDVDNLNSIEELEDYLTGVNEELKDVDINSKAFKDLSKQAAKADAKLKDINSELEGITSTDKSDSIKKMADGLVGGFAAAASASVLFGDQASEAMEKAMQKAAALFVAADGIDKIFQAMSKDNIKAFKAAVVGFGNAAKAAKSFATTTKGALISTGIGALIVALGLIIANFDKIKKAVKKNAESIKKYLKWILPPIYAIVEGVEFLIKKFGDLQNLVASVAAFIKKVFTFDGTGLKGATEEFEKQLAIEKEKDKLRDEYNKKITETTDQYDQQLQLLQEQGDKQQEILDLERERYEFIVNNLKKQEELGKLKEKDKKTLEDAEFQLKLIAIRQEKLNKLVKEKAEQEAKAARELAKQKKEKEDAIKKQQEQAKLAKESAIYEAKRAKIEAERSIVLEKINQEIQKIIDAEKINKENATKDIKIFSEALTQQINSIQQTLNFLQEYEQTSNKSYKSTIKDIEELQKHYDYLATTAANFSKINEIIPKEIAVATQALSQQYLKQRDVLNEINKEIEKYTGENEKGQGIILELLNKDKERLGVLIEQKKLVDTNLSLVRNQIKELEAVKNEESKTNELLRQQYESQKQLNDEKLKELNAVVATLEASNKLEKDEQKRAENNAKIAEAKLEIVQIQGEQYNLDKQINDLNQTTAETQKKINELKEQEKGLTAESARLEGEKGKLIVENVKLYDNVIEKTFKKFEQLMIKIRNKSSDVGEDLKDFFEEALTTINSKYEEVASQVGNLYSSIAAYEQAIADNRMKDLQEWEDKNKEVMDNLASLQQQYADQESEINDKLKDAEGDRYNDLLAQLNAVEKKKEEAAKEEKKLKNQEIDYQNAVNEAQYKADLAAKKAAIVNAIIQGALAVIKALPNLVLAGITTAAVGVGVAAIGKQQVYKPPKIPHIAAEGMLVGNSHATGGIKVEAEDGEYIVNKAATRAFLPLIDAINNAGKKFAEGAKITGQDNPAMPQGNVDLIDYDRLADAVSKAQIFVSVTEFNDVNNRLKIVEQRSSI